MSPLSKLERASKMSNRYLRKLLVVGAHAVLFHCKRCSDALRKWADHLMETEPFKLAAVATANKLARIAFALMRDEAHYVSTPA
jgi:transposase